MSTTIEHTVLPPQEGGVSLQPLLRTLGHRRTSATLVGAEGEHAAVPAEVLDVLRRIVDAMAHGQAITIAPHHTLLTTQEAAEFLGISRPTLIRRLDEGALPYETSGTHRRIRLTDLVHYQQRIRHERQRELDSMVAEGEDDGLYELDDVEPPRR